MHEGGLASVILLLLISILSGALAAVAALYAGLGTGLVILAYVLGNIAGAFVAVLVAWARSDPDPSGFADQRPHDQRAKITPQLSS